MTASDTASAASAQTSERATETLATADLVLRHGTVLERTTLPAGSPASAHFLPDHAVGIRAGRIAWVLPDAQVTPALVAGAESIDLTGHAVLPGFMNSHTHSPMTIFRGSAEDVPTESWFNDHIWPMETNLRPRDVTLGATIAIAEMLRAGVTSFADHYFCTEEIAAVVEQTGIRALLASTFFSSDGTGGLDSSAAFAQRWSGAADGRITTALGPHATYTVTDADLVRTAELARQVGTRIHIHAAENMDQTHASLAARGVTPIQVLHDTGVLDAGAIIAHGVGIIESDLPLLQAYADRVAVASCTKNYMKHAMGKGTPIRMLHEAGITVGVGTDGAASNNTLDVLESLRFLSLLNKNREEDATWLTSAHALDLLTRQSSALFGMSDTHGALLPGYAADIVAIDLRRPHLQPVHDLASTLVLSAASSDITTVIVDGRVLVRGGELTQLDLGEVYDELAARLPTLTDTSHGTRIQEYAP